MTMWDSIFQDYDGNSSKAYNMLEWFKDRTGTGYMVTGEAASNVTDAPIVSTASEPVTAASFILASLVYADGYDTRVYASESNASCYTSISVTRGIEMVIPRSEIGNPANDAWGHIAVVPEKYQQGNFNILYLFIRAFLLHLL